MARMIVSKATIPIGNEVYANKEKIHTAKETKRSADQGGDDFGKSGWQNCQTGWPRQVCPGPGTNEAESLIQKDAHDFASKAATKKTGTRRLSPRVDLA
jgi:hypothetical protein